MNSSSFPTFKFECTIMFTHHTPINQMSVSSDTFSPAYQIVPVIVQLAGVLSVLLSYQSHIKKPVTILTDFHSYLLHAIVKIHGFVLYTIADIHRVLVTFVLLYSLMHTHSHHNLMQHNYIFILLAEPPTSRCSVLLHHGFTQYDYGFIVQRDF